MHREPTLWQAYGWWIAAAFSLIYFLIILLLCFILYNWMQRVGTQENAEAAHG